MYYIGLNGERLLKERVTKEQLDELYKEFMNTYGKYIPEYMENNMKNDYLYGLEWDQAPCCVLQFYDEYNLMKKKYNIYSIFEDLVKHNYPELKNKTVLDLGGGVIPAIGRRLATDAKHVIVVDEYISPINNPSNLETIQCEVTDVKKLPKADLIVGFMPCGATRLVVDYAAYYNADFIMELCGCIHDPELLHSVYYNSLAGIYYDTYVNRLVEETKQKIVDSRLGKYKEYKASRLPFKVLGNKRV